MCFRVELGTQKVPGRSKTTMVTTPEALGLGTNLSMLRYCNTGRGYTGIVKPLGAVCRYFNVFWGCTDIVAPLGMCVQVFYNLLGVYRYCSTFGDV